MLWNLLSLIAGAGYFLSSFMAGKKVGGIGIFVGLFLGLGIGLLNFWGMRKVGYWTLNRWELYKPQLSPTRLMLSWSLFIVAFIWMLVSGWLGDLITRNVIAIYLS